MKASDFLEMMRQDIQTHSDKELLSEVLEVMKYVLSNKLDTEIDNLKTVDGCYEFMTSIAEKNKKSNIYCMSNNKTIEVVSKYLGITAPTIEQTPISVANKRKSINLDDFI